MILSTDLSDRVRHFPTSLGRDHNGQEQVLVVWSEEEYMRIAPHPQKFPQLFAKQQQLDGEIQDWSAETIRALKAPALLIIGDSDIIRPEHAVELFRLLGGGVVGDLVGLPRSQLAVLPGTTHVRLVEHAKWLVPMITQFLDAKA